jgi:hypothetical protein
MYPGDVSIHRIDQLVGKDSDSVRYAASLHYPLCIPRLAKNYTSLDDF